MPDRDTEIDGESESGPTGAATRLKAAGSSVLVAAGCLLALSGCRLRYEVVAPPHPPVFRWVFESDEAEVIACLDRVHRVGPWNEVIARTSPLPGQGVPQGDYLFEAQWRYHSPIYRSGSCPLKLYGKWIVHAERVDGGVEVGVWPFGETSLHNYRCGRFRAHPWGCATPVDSTNLEAHMLLASVGECLGETVPPPPIPDTTGLDPQTCRE